MAASVVIPNFNGRDLLSKNLPSLLKAVEVYPGDAEVIVVDDGSSDDSLALLRESFPGVSIVEHSENRGFGAHCLSGVQAASHPIAVLLNSDVTVAEGFLAPLVLPFQQDPSVFSVSPLILDREGKPSKITVNHPYLRGGDLRWRGVDPEDLLALSRLDPGEELEIHSLFGLGGAIAVSRERFLALGGFDPLYRPFYHEDVDLGLMAWRRGWKVLVEPRSVVTHEDGGTISRHYAPFNTKVARRRHRILCGWKHASGEWRSEQSRTHLRRVLTKWLTLDVRFYAAMAAAWRRRDEAGAARTREELESEVLLLDVFPRIAATWPPPALKQGTESTPDGHGHD